MESFKANTLLISPQIVRFEPPLEKALMELFKNDRRIEQVFFAFISFDKPENGHPTLCVYAPDIDPAEYVPKIGAVVHDLVPTNQFLDIFPLDGASLDAVKQLLKPLYERRLLV